MKILQHGRGNTAGKFEFDEKSLIRVVCSQFDCRAVLALDPADVYFIERPIDEKSQVSRFVFTDFPTANSAWLGMFYFICPEISCAKATVLVFDQLDQEVVFEAIKRHRAVARS